MPEIKCESCPLRMKYDAKPKSLLGRLWKFHIKFCPGWKMYLKSLSDESREEIYNRYGYRAI